MRFTISYFLTFSTKYWNPYSLSLLNQILLRTKNMQFRHWTIFRRCKCIVSSHLVIKTLSLDYIMLVLCYGWATVNSLVFDSQICHKQNLLTEEKAKFECSSQYNNVACYTWYKNSPTCKAENIMLKITIWHIMEKICYCSYYQFRLG